MSTERAEGADAIAVNSQIARGGWIDTPPTALWGASCKEALSCLFHFPHRLQVSRLHSFPFIRDHCPILCTPDIRFCTASPPTFSELRDQNIFGSSCPVPFGRSIVEISSKAVTTVTICSMFCCSQMVLQSKMLFFVCTTNKVGPHVIWRCTAIVSPVQKFDGRPRPDNEGHNVKKRLYNGDSNSIGSSKKSSSGSPIHSSICARAIPKQVDNCMLIPNRSSLISQNCKEQREAPTQKK